MGKPHARVILPPPHKGGQEKFFYWNDEHQEAQCLVGPCGTKVGKSFGCALWLSKEALLNPGVYCVWIAPTYLKCRIGYRYMKAMLDIPGVAECIDGRLEIRLANGSFIKFLHGRDAEVTVEGEAIDRYVIDECGKIARQVWYSLLTTITQTGGIGILTGTPRGFNWYYEVFREAKRGDNPFFVWTSLKTSNSPYVKKEAIDKARKLLPKALFDQYYEAVFTSSGAVFGDLSGIWDETFYVPPGPIKFWIHPDPAQRAKDIFHGVDVAKKRDFTVFYSINTDGQMVGFCRFRTVPYPLQAKRFEQYIKRYFAHATDNICNFDCTGVGEAVGDLFYELDLDVSFNAVVFTNKSKANMVTRLTLAIEQDWLKMPRIEQVEHEMGSYEVSVTKTGLHSYAAATGEHDDIVSAMMLAVSSAFSSALAEEAEKVLEEAMNGKVSKTGDDILDYVEASYKKEDDFFDDSDEDAADAEFEFEGTYG